MKNLDNLRRMSNDQLKNRLSALYPEIHRASMFFKKNQGQAPQGTKTRTPNGVNTKFLHNLKKERARILTILSERSLNVKRTK